MREIVLDTETTGLDPASGDKIVEIGAVELENHMPTGRVYHQYINPQRSMPQEAFNIHGLSDDFLRDKPVFKDIAHEFLAFIEGSTLVIHNAAFDMKFLNAELKAAQFTPLNNERALDTVLIARRKFPGSPASLDALCKRFGIDNSMREKHGALLDSEILAEVYVELIGGRQPDLALAHDRQNQHGAAARTAHHQSAPRRPAPLPSRLSAQEAEAHADFVKNMGDAALWRKYQNVSP